MSIFLGSMSVLISELKNVSIFSGKSEIVSIFHLMVGNKDFYHLKI